MSTHTPTSTQAVVSEPTKIPEPVCRDCGAPLIRMPHYGPNVWGCGTPYCMYQCPPSILNVLRIAQADIANLFAVAKQHDTGQYVRELGERAEWRIKEAIQTFDLMDSLIGANQKTAEQRDAALSATIPPALAQELATYMLAPIIKSASGKHYADSWSRIVDILSKPIALIKNVPEAP